MTRDPIPITIIMSGDPERSGVIWPWAVIACWGGSVIGRTRIHGSRVGRDRRQCGRYRCRGPDYGACHGEGKEQGVIVMAISGLGIDRCQNQKQYETDA